MSKRALITGITGQDGSYLARLLLKKGYEVHGVVRQVAIEDPEGRLWRLREVIDSLNLHAGSIESLPSLYRIVTKVKPDECYHLAAHSFVSYEFDDEFSTISTNINGTHYILSTLRDLVPECHFYFAASSEMFGRAKSSPQNEDTPFHPRSAYGISKVAGFDLARNYREVYDLHCSSGILFNHESPRRGLEFVTRKISHTVGQIKLGLAHSLHLGNLDARRDWGFSGDYVNAMWQMLQQDSGDDYVVATGESHSVREFAAAAFACLDLDWQDHVEVDASFFRVAEQVPLIGDASKARSVLGWTPTVRFPQLVQMMVQHDYDQLRNL